MVYFFYDNLVVLKKNALPAILIEVGMLTNPKDFYKITHPKGAKKFMDAVAVGIQNHLLTYEEL